MRVTAEAKMGSREHVVQFFGQDEERLARNVAACFRRCLRQGGAVVIIANPSRGDAIGCELRRYGDPGLNLSPQRFQVFDDRETLAKFMRRGRVDGELLESRVFPQLAELCERYGRVCAYGEMVGRLWSEGAFGAAIDLEERWDELVHRLELDVFCGYPIDVVSEDFQICTVQALLKAHTGVVPALSAEAHRAIRRAMSDVLGSTMHGLAALPTPEQTILHLRAAYPRYADEILAKSREYA
jgi:hypothetical protein